MRSTIPRRHSRTRPQAPRVVARISAGSQGLRPLLRVGKQHVGSLSGQQLPANVGPGDRAIGSLLVVSPPAIQLSPLIRAQRQFPLALVVGQTLPERHRQAYPIARREPQKLREHAGFHGEILSCSIRCGNRVHDEGDVKLLGKSLKGAVFRFQIKSLKNGTDDSIHALYIPNTHHRSGPAT